MDNEFELAHQRTIAHFRLGVKYVCYRKSWYRSIAISHFFVYLLEKKIIYEPCEPLGSVYY